jgi:hypothetical protein
VIVCVFWADDQQTSPNLNKQPSCSPDGWTGFNTAAIYGPDMDGLPIDMKAPYRMGSLGSSPDGIRKQKHMQKRPGDLQRGFIAKHATSVGSKDGKDVWLHVFQTSKHLHVFCLMVGPLGAAGKSHKNNLVGVSGR